MTFPVGVSTPSWDAPFVSGGGTAVVTDGGATVTMTPTSLIGTADTTDRCSELNAFGPSFRFRCSIEPQSTGIQARLEVVTGASFGAFIDVNLSDQTMPGHGITFEGEEVLSAPFLPTDASTAIELGWDCDTGLAYVIYQDTTYTADTPHLDHGFWAYLTLLTDTNAPPIGDGVTYHDLEVEVLAEPDCCPSGETGLRGLYVDVCGGGPCCP